MVVAFYSDPVWIQSGRQYFFDLPIENPFIILVEIFRYNAFDLLGMTK